MTCLADRQPLATSHYRLYHRALNESLETNMRSILLGGVFGLWICAAACGQPDVSPAPDTAPAATESAPAPEAETVPASAPVSQPATRPAPLQIAGLPARQWLNAPAPIHSRNLEGRLWVLGILEPWSDHSRRAAAQMADLAKTWSSRGVEILLVTGRPG